MTDTGPRPEDAENINPDEIVPDYTRVGFKDLRRLCTARGIPADGNAATLVEKLRAWDVQHGKEVDLSALDDSDPDIDLTGDDLGVSPAAPEASARPEPPVGAGEAASAPAPTGSQQISVPDGGAVTSAAPAVVVVADPDAPQGPPQAAGLRGKPNLSTREGLVKVGEGHGAAAVYGYRMEFPHGYREITDGDHFAYIADTHAAAQKAGHQTKGGITIGERVGFGVDADGRRTVIYQVNLKRQR